ncbi:hypothetical protein ACOKSH_12790 [Vibrio cholerae]
MANLGKSFATPVYANGRLSVYDKYGSFVARFCDEWSRDAFIKACNEENGINAVISKDKETVASSQSYQPLKLERDI